MKKHCFLLVVLTFWFLLGCDNNRISGTFVSKESSTRKIEFRAKREAIWTFIGAGEVCKYSIKNKTIEVIDHFNNLIVFTIIDNNTIFEELNEEYYIRK